MNEIEQKRFHLIRFTAFSTFPSRGRLNKYSSPQFLIPIS